MDLNFIEEEFIPLLEYISDKPNYVKKLNEEFETDADFELWEAWAANRARYLLDEFQKMKES